jgi:hypothetical protein
MSFIAERAVIQYISAWSFCTGATPIKSSRVRMINIHLHSQIMLIITNGSLFANGMVFMLHYVTAF